MKIEDVIPCNGYCVIEPIEFEAKGGIVIPDTVKKERVQKGKVLAVAETNMSDSGIERPINFKTGDTVFFGAFAGEDIPFDDDKTYRLVEILFVRGVLNSK